jgi:hypothetical protein
MLMAQAQVEYATLITSDDMLRAYAVPLLWVSGIPLLASLVRQYLHRRRSASSIRARSCSER